VVESDLIVQPLRGGANGLHRDASLANGPQYERLGKADEGHGRVSAGRREHSDQWGSVLRTSPGVQRRQRRLQIGRALWQREERDRRTTVSGSQRPGCCEGGHRAIVSPTDVVSRS
jgi:hypothetical protein